MVQFECPGTETPWCHSLIESSLFEAVGEIALRPKLYALSSSSGGHTAIARSFFEVQNGSTGVVDASDGCARRSLSGRWTHTSRLRSPESWRAELRELTPALRPGRGKTQPRIWELAERYGGLKERRADEVTRKTVTSPKSRVWNGMGGKEGVLCISRARALSDSI